MEFDQQLSIFNIMISVTKGAIFYKNIKAHLFNLMSSASVVSTCKQVKHWQSVISLILSNLESFQCIQNISTVSKIVEQRVCPMSQNGDNGWKKKTMFECKKLSSFPNLE